MEQIKATGTSPFGDFELIFNFPDSLLSDPVGSTIAELTISSIELALRKAVKEKYPNIDLKDYING